MAGFIIALLILMLINPKRDAGVLRVTRSIENTNWAFFSLINMEIFCEIYLNSKDTPTNTVFITFIAVLACIFPWKGAQLYIDVFNLEAVENTFPFRYEISSWCNNIGNLLPSGSAGGTFLDLGKLLR